MSVQTHWIEIDGVVYVVEGEYNPGEPTVMYYKDMSGSPGCPHSFNVLSVTNDGNECLLTQEIEDEIEELILNKYYDL